MNKLRADEVLVTVRSETVSSRLMSKNMKLFPLLYMNVKLCLACHGKSIEWGCSRIGRGRKIFSRKKKNVGKITE
jgi:hypothetical protein